MSKSNKDTSGTSTKVRIEVFRSGEFKPMVGDAISYSGDDLTRIVEAYDPDISPAPIVVGHPKTDTPAYGWVDGFEYDAEADRLYADASIAGEFSETIKAGYYKNVSMSFFKPDAPNNPHPGSWYPKHIGFLGAAAPAVSGLKPVSFAGDQEGVTFLASLSPLRGSSPLAVASFGEAGFEDAASLLRSIRDFFIEKFGMEAADKVLPAYRLEWLAETEIRKGEDKPYSFSETPTATKPEDVAMTPEEIAAEKAALDKRKADQDAREAAFAEREASRRADDNAAFAEELVQEGRLLPASRDQVAAILSALPADQDVSFAGDDGKEQSQPLADTLRAILKAQPVAVDFSAQDMGDDPNTATTASFASDGNEIDTGQLVIDQKARAYMKQNPGVDYIAAVQAVS